MKLERILEQKDFFRNIVISGEGGWVGSSYVKTTSVTVYELTQVYDNTAQRNLLTGENIDGLALLGYLTEIILTDGIKTMYVSCETRR